jgi:hypothetical protein
MQHVQMVIVKVGMDANLLRLLFHALVASASKFNSIATRILARIVKPVQMSIKARTLSNLQIATITSA